MWACEKFANYIQGKEFTIETDHKLLVPLLGSKCLQRFCMRLMWYSYQIVHVPGKDLSRAPLYQCLTKDERARARQQKVEFGGQASANKLKIS